MISFEVSKPMGALEDAKKIELEKLEAKFSEFLIASDELGKEFNISFNATELSFLHGFVLLGLKHPEVQQTDLAPDVGREILEKVEDIFKEEGFTDSEILLLDTLEEGEIEPPLSEISGLEKEMGELRARYEKLKKEQIELNLEKYDIMFLVENIEGNNECILAKKDGIEMEKLYLLFFKTILEKFLIPRGMTSEQLVSFGLWMNDLLFEIYDSLTLNFGYFLKIPKSEEPKDGD